MPSFVEQNQIKYYGKYLEEQLIKHQKEFYKTDTLEHWGLNPDENFHTAYPDLRIGMDKMAFYTKENFGSAGIYDGMSNDIPIVNTQAGKLGEVNKVILMNAAEWSYFDLQQMEFAESTGYSPTMDVIRGNQEAMGEFIDRKTHEIILYGEPEREIYGLYNQPGITQLKLDVELYNPAVTPQDLYKIFLTIIQAFSDFSLITNPSMQDYKLPERFLKRLAEPYSNLTGTTLYQMLTSSQLGYNVSSISSARENSGLHLYQKNVFPSLLANRDRIIIKTTTPSISRNYYARTQFPPTEVDSIKWRQISFSGTTGLYTIRPNRVMYVDFLNTIT